MKNLLKKLILFSCVVLIASYSSWSQVIQPTYDCTGSGTVSLYVSPTTGITGAYVWRKGGIVIAGETGSSILNQTSGSYSVTYDLNGTSTTSSKLVPVIVPATPAISPATGTPPIVICGSATQVLTSSSSTFNYIWERDGTAITTALTNSITVSGTDVVLPGNYNYTLSLYNSESTCTSPPSNTVTLTISPPLATPTISTSDVSTLICGSSTNTLTASGGGASYVWKRGSTTLLNTGSSLTLTGTDTPAGTNTYTAALTNTTGCLSNYSAGVSLTLSPAAITPSITTAPNPNPICGTATQILTASTGGTTYIWRRSGTIVTGSTNTITVTGNDVTLENTYNFTVSATNSAGCVSAESPSFVLKVSPKPSSPTISPATFNPNIICGSDTRTLTATGGATIYTWKRGGVALTGFTTNTLNVAGTDVLNGGTYIYTASLTNSVGCVSDDSPTGVTLQLFPLIPATPIITASGAATFCQGGSVTLNYTRGVTSDIKFWSRTTGADTTTTNADGITVRNTNTFSVKTKDVNGCFSLPSATFAVTVNPNPTAPIIDRGTADAICDLESITLTSNNKGTGKYLWNSGQVTSSITVRNAGSYFLTFTDGNSCTSLPSTPFVLTINPLPEKPTITNLRRSEFCYRDFATLRASSATAGTTFEWDYQNSTANQIDIAGSSKKTVDEIIRVSVRAVSAFSNSSISQVCKSRESSDITTITVYPLPITPSITASGPITFCPDSTVSLTSTDSPNGYKWINATKNNTEFSNQKVVVIDTTSKFYSITPLGKVGKFYVRTISDKSCLSDTSRNVIVTVRNAPQKAVINPSPISATVCQGGKVTLDALISNGNINRYSWRDEKTKREISTLKSFQVDTAGTYSVRLRDVFGCFADNSAPLKVTINPLPIKPSLSIVRPKIFCDEDSTSLQSSLPSTTPNGKNLYTWIVDGQTVLETSNRLFYWKKAGSIAVAVTDSNGCKASLSSDTIRTTVNPLPPSPSIIARGAIPFCADKNVTLSASGVNGVTFKWSTGATTTNITTNLAGNITVQSINGFGCFSKPSQAILVRVNPLPATPKLTASGETAFCDGSKIRILSSSPFQAFWWRNTADSVGKGEDLNSIFASTSGNYFAKVQDDNGCISLASTPIIVAVKPNPTPTIIKQIGSFSLDAQGIGDENGYIWRYNGDVRNDLTTRIIKAKQDGNYQVQASITYTGLPITGGRLVCYSNTSTALKYVQDLSFNGYSVFPNPTSNGEINVEVVEDLIDATISVYSLYGQLILEYKVDKFNTSKKIKLPNYEGNTFIVKISSDGFDRTKRVITFNQ